MKMLAILPALNESAAIGDLVTEVRSSRLSVDVLVIDDGSSDATGDIAKTSGASVVTLPYNLGIGGAVQTGYLFALEHGYDVVVRLDGDGQHDPLQVSKLIGPLLRGEADVVIGSRYLFAGGQYTSSSRAVGVKLFAWLVSRVAGSRYTDTTSGFQAANRRAIAFLAEHLPCDYPEIEGLVLLCRAGYCVREVSVTMRPRSAGRSSITSVRAFYYALKVSVAVLIEAMRSAPGQRQVEEWADGTR